jgi:hypothetical protein
MSEPEILYPAIFVFSMLLIGLLLTMWEFSRLQKRQQQKIDRDEHVTGRDFQASRDSVPKPLHF